MEKIIVSTEKAPGAIGPYSQAIKANGMVYASGQIPIDPATGEIVPGDVQAQTKQSLENVKALLDAAGTSLEKVVKTTVFIQSMDDFAAINEIYSQYFTGNYPARSCVEVAKLPKGALVEVEVIALQ